ncbi:MAG: hypothetical protein ACOYN4_11790 [Bacteroidales bacterium]
MITVIIFVYVLVGGLSLFSGIGKWLFNSYIWAITMLPFMVAYYLIKGDEKKRAEAIDVCKLFLVLTAVFFIVYFTASWLS